MSIIKSRDDSEAGTKRVSQWEDLMRKFSEAHKEECKTLSMDIPRVQRDVKQFPTRSQYEGTWDLLGMSGYGVYKFPNDVVYEGEFDDGMFHGQGELKYPSGEILRGTWKKGQLTNRTLIFADGLEYSETDWMYCRFPDRRFTREYNNGLQPAGQSYLTAEQPSRTIPTGYYDTGDGFYDPLTKVVYKFNDLTAILRYIFGVLIDNKFYLTLKRLLRFIVYSSRAIGTKFDVRPLFPILVFRSPSVREQKWIIENCRTSPDIPLGPRKDLYEEWVEPQELLPESTAPASTCVATEALGSYYVNEPDHEIEVEFKNLEKDESDSSSSSDF